MCVCALRLDDWRPDMNLKDPYWSPTSPTTDDNLITSAESEIGRICFVCIRDNVCFAVTLNRGAS